MDERRLYRSEDDRMLAGVCGGLGAYLGVDPTIVRIVFLLLVFASGLGLVLYVAMWIVVPRQSRLDAPAPEVAREGMADIRERAREGARQARAAASRVRRRSSPAGPASEPEPPGAGPPVPPVPSEPAGPAAEPEPPGVAPEPEPPGPAPEPPEPAGGPEPRQPGPEDR